MCDVNQLASQLLELSKQLATSSKSFKITLRTEGINFSICSQDCLHPGQDEHHPGSKKEKKSKSPSQKKRDAERRKSFLMKKLEDTNSLIKPSEATDISGHHGDKVESDKCELCDFSADCKVSLGIHIQKEHSQIPQIDGLEDSSIKGMDSNPFTCKECDYTSNTDRGMEDHTKSKHIMKQVEVKKPLETVMTAEERKLESDFTRTYVLTSTMGNCEMWCHRCNNQWFNRIDFKNHMMNSHDKKIFIDIK